MNRRSTEIQAGGEPAEAALVEQAQAGDTEALNLLLARHFPLLLRHVRHRCGDCSLAEDLCQEACTKAISQLSDLHCPTAFGAWIQRFLENEAHHCERKNCRKSGTEPQAIGTYTIEGIGVEAPDHSVEDARWLWNVLWQQANPSNGPKGRIADFMLRHYSQEEEFPSLRTIAQATRTSLGTTQRSRAAVLRQWRRALKAEGLYP